MKLLDISKYQKDAARYGRQNPMTASSPPDWDVDCVLDTMQEDVEQHIIECLNEDISDLLHSGACDLEMDAFFDALKPFMVHEETSVGFDDVLAMMEALQSYRDAYAKEQALLAREAPEDCMWVTYRD